MNKPSVKWAELDSMSAGVGGIDQARGWKWVEVVRISLGEGGIWGTLCVNTHMNSSIRGMKG